jgi:hypothetical protein
MEMVVVSDFAKTPCCCLAVTTLQGFMGGWPMREWQDVSASGRRANRRRDDGGTRSSVHFVLRR